MILDPRHDAHHRRLPLPSSRRWCRGRSRWCRRSVPTAARTWRRSRTSTPSPATPPLVGIAISDRAGDPKDTLRNIRDTHEFVVNVVSEAILDAMVRTAGEWPARDERVRACRIHAGAERARAAALCRRIPAPARVPACTARSRSGTASWWWARWCWRACAMRMLTDGRVDPPSWPPWAGWGASLCAARAVLRRSRPKVSRATGGDAG
jgi:hypothetical protein